MPSSCHFDSAVYSIQLGGWLFNGRVWGLIFRGPGVIIEGFQRQNRIVFVCSGQRQG